MLRLILHGKRYAISSAPTFFAVVRKHSDNRKAAITNAMLLALEEASTSAATKEECLEIVRGNFDHGEAKKTFGTERKAAAYQMIGYVTLLADEAGIPASEREEFVEQYFGDPRRAKPQVS